jgi:hypothetical protein
LGAPADYRHAGAWFRHFTIAAAAIAASLGAMSFA